MISGMDELEDLEGILASFCARFNADLSAGIRAKLIYELKGRRIYLSAALVDKVQIELLQLTYIKGKKGWRYIWKNSLVEWRDLVGISTTLQGALTMLSDKKYLIEQEFTDLPSSK
ncbi:hypothetical protein QVN42_03365 [Yersinia nurmii]|uniref:Uncharacterized protein n=1 Tax=Yersinia nurmii TaxID=685706 RepID=A0AAW7K261_9GAMM|nr:hypothetical protein [Yersinia nurmii]MDN0086442.1 hypothetical protein [Yersinia nurmii]CNE52752.1 Uncharacterised protein [Yersinia nurmii]